MNANVLSSASFQHLVWEIPTFALGRLKVPRSRARLCPRHYTLCNQPMSHRLLRAEHVVRVVIFRLKTRTCARSPHMHARRERENHGGAGSGET